MTPSSSELALGQQVSTESGTTWAVLIAGSKDYVNYRHQADVCHAYQLLKSGGLKDEHIIVFMYDDIAHHPDNPRPGTLINHPQGHDVYAGVPKDYNSIHVTPSNIYAVLLGDKSLLKGGSGKVVDSKPNDRIFIFFSGHGGPRFLFMPNSPRLLAADLLDVLKKKHLQGSYKSMLIYVEACHSGSLFESILPDDLNIYAMTAAHPEESSYGAYCSFTDPPSPSDYQVCVGDRFSAAWMEDSEAHDRRNRSIEDQYKEVKRRTHDYIWGSRVMEYGSKHLKKQTLSLYQGYNPQPFNVSDAINIQMVSLWAKPIGQDTTMRGVKQIDIYLFYLWGKYKRSSGLERAKVTREIRESMAYMVYLDSAIDMIGLLLFGPQHGRTIIHSVRAPGLPLVDDWECLTSIVDSFERHCGLLTEYGMRHLSAFANICNKQVPKLSIEESFTLTCVRKMTIPHGMRN